MFNYQEAGINPKLAQTVGIAVDHRRTNKCVQSLQSNVLRLREYKSRLIVFPRKANRVKKGDSSKEDISNAQQLKGDIIPAPKADSTVQFVKVSEVIKYCV